MKMTSIDIISSMIVEDAHDYVSSYLDGDVKTDWKNYTDNRQAHNRSVKCIEKKDNKRGSVRHISRNQFDRGADGKNIQECGIYFRWARRYTKYRSEKIDISLINRINEGNIFKDYGWYIELIREYLSITSSFACLHLVSFAMHQEGIVADRAVYNALSSGGFFQKYNIDSPRFGVSRYSMQYFSSYIEDTSEFDEALKRIDLVIRDYCGLNSVIIGSLSKRAGGDQDIKYIFSKYIGENDGLLSEELIFNIDRCLSDISTAKMIYNMQPKIKISKYILNKLAKFEKASNKYDSLVEFMSSLCLPINERNLAAWVLESPSFMEALKRVRLAFRNNPTGYQCYVSSLGNWIATSDDFAALKRLDEELGA